MVFTITQQTFDEAVQENIDVLGLSLEDSVVEAINQFKAQDVDLSQIVTDPTARENLQEVTRIIEQLKEFVNNPESQDCLAYLTALKEICEKGLQLRVQAGKCGAYDALVNIFLNSSTEGEIKLIALKTIFSLMTKQPDLLDDRGVQVILSNLAESQETEILKITLKWCKECCVMHEMNRQKFMEMNIVHSLSTFIQNGNLVLLKETLAVLRALLLDDDVRVEFGRAHENARIIANETLVHIIKLLSSIKLQPDDSVTSDLLLTLSALLVRAEFCVEVDASGGIETIHEIMKNSVSSERIIRQCFKVLKALAGNDECKVNIIQKGLAPTISASLNFYQKNVPTAVAGLGCIAALSLRCPGNSRALFEASVPDVIIGIMKKHPDEKSVQKSASWAIRNMVSRSRYQNERFLELGTEEILKSNLVSFKEFEYDTKAALRDLECNVELKEEWTGKGGRISSETSLKRD